MSLSKPLWGLLLVAGFAAGCFTDKPSAAFECGSQADCSNGRQCISGYCVVPQCPSDCTSCDEVKHTCLVECATGDRCGGVTCPDGWSCTISCSGDGACGDVTCQAGSTCDITCSGDNACQDISCRDACACDLSCGAGACGTMTCPMANGSRCTADGTAGTACDSAPAGCTKC